MQDVGISIVLKDNTISYFHSISLKKKQIITVNADWSSAAYWFTWVALHSESEIFIENLKKMQHSIRQYYRRYSKTVWRRNTLFA